MQNSARLQRCDGATEEIGSERLCAQIAFGILHRPGGDSHARDQLRDAWLHRRQRQAATEKQTVADCMGFPYHGSILLAERK